MRPDREFSIALCMKDPGPCSNCGAQTSLMYAAFSRGQVINNRYVSGERVSKPLCQDCAVRPDAAFIVEG
jgi:hypothetical protein